MQDLLVVLTVNEMVRHMATSTVLDFSIPHVLRNAREYRAAVAEIDRLLDVDAKRGTKAGERLEFLSVLVEAYEDSHDPLDAQGGTPQSVVAFMLEQRGMTRADLTAHMGGKGRVSVLQWKAAVVDRADSRAARRARDSG